MRSRFVEGAEGLVVRLVGADEVPRFNALLDEHHFLGHCLSGRVLRYVAMVSGEWVALVGFGSAALSVRVREELIGWDEATRYRRLRYVSNNQRFCVLPGGRGPNVASAVLGGVLRRLSDDMRSVYGHRVVMVETFTDPSRHRGSCYAAANFRPLGETSGFGRRNGSWVYHGHPKRYWFYPLRKDAVRLLSASFDHPLLCSTGHEEARMIDLNQIVIDGDGGLRARLSTLVDHRKARGVRHDLVSLLLVCATAMLSGARNPTEIAEFGDALSEDLRKRLGLRVAPSSGARVAPSLSTIQRTLRHTDKEAFDRVVCDTLAELVTNKRERDNNSLNADTDDTDDTDGDSTGSASSTGASGGAAKRLYGVAVDGKTLRGAVQPDGRAIHLLAAMTHDDKVVIGQQEVDHKTNEIKLFAPLLADLDLKDALVTADALHTQDAHANFLVNEKHADFFLFVKENQPSLYNEFVCTPENAYLEAYSESGKGHGRIETRTIRVAPTPSGLVEFPHVAAIVRIDRVVHDAKTGQLKWEETAWAVTSASPKRAKPPRLLAASRDHWGIENELHWVRDATMREDSSKVRSGSAPRVLATLRNLAISVLRLAGAKKHR